MAEDNLPAGLGDSFGKQLSCDDSFLFQLFDLFPIPVELFRPDGVSAFINAAFMECFHISDPSMIVGRLNIREDLYLLTGMNLAEYIESTLSGAITSLADMRVPFEEIKSRYNPDLEGGEPYDMYQDIICFPLRDDLGAIRYVVTMFLTKHVYREQQEIIKAKEYISTHWQDEFSAEDVARASGFSSRHFFRLFKKHTGMTPYSYYQELKIKKLKEALRDKDSTVGQAFASCGLAYHGSWASLFREKVGMTPSEYRKSILK